jgi:AraC-like DNA-binding protein
MVQNRIIVLSDDDAIFDRVRSAGSVASVTGIACLTEPCAAGSGSTLIIDPGAVHPCCLDRLGEWSRQRPLRQVVYLCLPAPPGILFSLPHVHPGRVAELREIESLLRRDGRRASIWSTWQEMGNRLTDGAGDHRRRRFLELMRTRHAQGRSAAQVAAALGVGVRHLSRLMRRWFGVPPRVMLGLFRVECVARDLRSTGTRLTDLASMHGYSTRQGMSRQFQAYTGLTPVAYRLSAQRGRETHLRVVPVPEVRRREPAGT